MKNSCPIWFCTWASHSHICSRASALVIDHPRRLSFGFMGPNWWSMRYQSCNYCPIIGQVSSGPSTGLSDADRRKLYGCHTSDSTINTWWPQKSYWSLMAPPDGHHIASQCMATTSYLWKLPCIFSWDMKFWSYCNSWRYIFIWI